MLFRSLSKFQYIKAPISFACVGFICFCGCVNSNAPNNDDTKSIASSTATNSVNTSGTDQPPIAPLESSYEPAREAIVFYGSHLPPFRFTVNANALQLVAKKHDSVKQIIVGSCLIETDAIKQLREWSEVRRLSFICSELPKESLEELSKLRQLRLLELSYCKMESSPDEIFAVLSQMSWLEFLATSGNPDLSARLAKALPNTNVIDWENEDLRKKKITVPCKF